jgi:hypothetical protein
MMFGETKSKVQCPKSAKIHGLGEKNPMSNVQGPMSAKIHGLGIRV